jgi:hypothetical protein
VSKSFKGKTLPIDWGLTMLLKVGIGLGEVSATYEPTISAEWARVNRCEHKMTTAIYKLSFALCIATPKHKNDILTLIIKCLYRSIGQFFPTFSLMTSCTMSLYRERGIQQ